MISIFLMQVEMQNCRLNYKIECVDRNKMPENPEIIIDVNIKGFCQYQHGLMRNSYWCRNELSRKPSWILISGDADFSGHVRFLSDALSDGNRIVYSIPESI
jgi:hypothetical protein